MPVIRSGSKTLLLGALGLLILLLVSRPAGPLYADALPDPGHGFYGAVTVNGRNAAVGTVVSARVAGVEHGSRTLTDPGQYALVVQGDITEGATIDFYVNDQKADQTFPFREGWTTELDLTAPGDPFDCLIATAAYGNPTAEQIDVLREFRDVVLLESAAGSLFVALYYRLSPPAAVIMSRNGVLRTLVRDLLVDPVVRMSGATEHVWRSKGAEEVRGRTYRLAAPDGVRVLLRADAQPGPTFSGCVLGCPIDGLSFLRYLART